MDALEICNKLRSEASGVATSGIPLDVFPQKMQQMILDLARTENYSIEFTATSLISAMAAAVGNSCYIRIKGNWITSPILYVILVGRPGVGKTPPLNFAYKPLHDIDTEEHHKFKALKNEYAAIVERNKGKKRTEWESLPPVPVLHKNIMNDFTPEILMRNHDANLRGVAVVVDEIMGLFNTINRYNNSSFVQQMLSAHNGLPVDVSRCNLDCPLRIDYPCIQIVGTIQTGIVHELYDMGFKKNGFLDRFLITCPKGLKIAPWVKVPKQDAAIIERPFRVWKEIIDKAVALPFTEGIFNVLDFSDEAIDIFYDWQNEDIERQNAITDEKMIDSRAAKVPLNTARLALIFQLFRWACDESHKDFVDAESVNAAIRMSDYFEKSYKRMDDLVLTEATDPVKKQVLDSLGNKFVTAEAVKAGADFGFARRTVMYMLKDFCQRNFIIKDKQGNYEKVQLGYLLLVDYQCYTL